LWVNLADADYIREVLQFPGCQIALRVDRDVLNDAGEVLSHDTRYFLTSLDPDRVCAEQLLQTVRQHWQIENTLHFTKDRWWDEDRHHTRRPGVGEALARLNSLALTVLRTLYPPDLPLRARADYIAWNPRLGLELLGFQ
jgi:predicted transposase YbfD/YdcC